VELFFLISGYLIYTSFNRFDGSFPLFILRRWKRLVPAMLVTSALIYFLALCAQERPLGQPKLLDLLPGLLFIHPFIVEKLIGISVAPIEWSY
jgi:peptidoglycan/LPS O-acetylase OafA/YrhL